MQGLINLIYPPLCLACGEPVAETGRLCGPCRAGAHFILDPICDTCGQPLPGPADDGPALCDDCLRIDRPWDRGRAALVYDATGRALVLALKHGDRHDIARPAARWMIAAAGGVISPDQVAIPVPIHLTRLARRRFNQAALLSREVARLAGIGHLPDALFRRRITPKQDGLGVEARFANLSGAIGTRHSAAARIAGRKVVLIDDVMTSGATLAAACEAVMDAGAEKVDVLVLARVAKSP